MEANVIKAVVKNAVREALAKNGKYDFLKSKANLSDSEENELDDILRKIAELTRQYLSTSDKDKKEKIDGETDKLKERRDELMKKRGF